MLDAWSGVVTIAVKVHLRSSVGVAKPVVAIVNHSGQLIRGLEHVMRFVLMMAQSTLVMVVMMLMMFVTLVMMLMIPVISVDPVLIEGLAVLVSIPGLWSIRIPLQPSRLIEVAGPGLPDHMMWHWLAQDPLHHGNVFPVVMSLKQGVTLQ